MWTPLRHLNELVKFREVLMVLIDADMKVRYRRSVLGYLWGLLNPLCMIGILSFVFSHLMRFEMEAKSYVLYLFSGLLPWQFFVNSVIDSSTTLIVAEPVLKKVYLPKMLFPAASIAARFVDFCFNMAAVFIIISLYHFKPSWALLALPAALFLLVILAASLAVMMAALTVYLRDLGHLLYVLAQLGFYLTPIIYPLRVIPPEYQIVLKMNPMTHVIGLFQQIVCEGVLPSAAEWGLVAAFVTLISFCSLSVYHALERRLIFRL